ncbi:MAG: hypothetical protein U1E14_16360 [Geminicoccaceae bacterium]
MVTRIGTANADFLTGSAQGDTLVGQGGNDRLAPGAGLDLVAGGTGLDFVDYGASDAAVRIDLAATIGDGGDWVLAQGGHAQGDILASIEAVIGSSFADDLHGNDMGNTFYGGGRGDDLRGRGGDDYLDGGNGADALRGGSGGDGLHGGAGIDQCWGGAGGDVFSFASALDSGVGAGNRDVVADWDGADRLSFRGLVDEVTGISLGRFVGKAAFDGDNQVRFQHGDGTTVVQVNLDEDGQAELEVLLKGVHQLDAADIIF